MINLRKRFDKQPDRPERASGDRSTDSASATALSTHHNPGLDEAGESVEPTPGTYLARRASVVVVAILLLAIGAVGGRQVLRTGAVPTAALTVPPTSTTPTTPPPTSEAPPAEVPTAESTPPAVAELPDGTSRLVPLDPERILDTGEEATGGRKYSINLERDWAAVALSITLAAPSDAGSVLVDGGTGAIEVVAVDSPGQATTNLVFVPIAGNTLSTWSTAGGRVIIDLVGVFEESAATNAGRFVPVDPTEITHLIAEEDGRETDLRLETAVPIDEVDAVLVVVGADVGDDGGVVRFGPAAENYDQQLMWGPANGTRQRRGLVLLRPNDLGEVHLRYEGGTELSAHVVGYFTNGNRPTSTAGLYLPTGPRRLHDGVLRPSDPVVVGDLEPLAATALVTVGSTSISSGRLGSYLVPVDDGQVTLTPSTEVDSVVTLLGVFLGEV